MKRSDLIILIVDDEMIVREAMSSWLIGEGYNVDTAGSGEEALSLVRQKSFDIALIDLQMPGMDGIQVMERIRELNRSTLCLILTAYGTVNTAVSAMKLGAYDYIGKPVNPEEVSLVIERLSAHLKLIQENKLLKKTLEKKSTFGSILTRNEEMLQLFEIARQVARSKSTVLLLGESGTGKELLARAIHEESPRKHAAFVAVSCAALTETLLEDEIFGHEKGAFTDAKEVRQGKFELAHQGTIFLDEIGDISAKLQLDLLRIIQEKEFTRLGGNKVIRVDVRLISATNRNVEAMVQSGEFRDDLFYRLNIVTLTIPPLRKRKEDIPLLADHFLKKFSLEMRQNSEITISREAMNLLLEYQFPGNVRELEGAIEHAVIFCRDNIIQVADLPSRIRQVPDSPDVQTELVSLEDLEKTHISKVLQENEFNISKCSRVLGIDRSTLYLKMQKYNLVKKKG